MSYDFHKLQSLTPGASGELFMGINHNGAPRKISLDDLVALIGGGGGGMIYPGAGIALSTGSGWGTSITNNSGNWNTAYGWGNHAGLYATASHVHDAADITTGVLTVLRGGTGINTYTAGDLIYASGSSTLAKLSVGTNGHVLTLAAGVPTWAAAGGGTPAGSSGQIQFNNSGALGASANLFWDASNNRLGVNQSTPLYALHIKVDALGTSSSNGIMLQNSTAAALGAQQVSPAIVWSGFGNGSTSGSASQNTSWRAFVNPVQTAGNPTNVLLFQSNINGAGYSDKFSLSDNGIVSATIGNAVGNGALLVHGDITVNNTTSNFNIRSSSTNPAQFTFYNAGSSAWRMGSANFNFSFTNANYATTLMYAPNVSGTPRIGMNTTSPAASSILDLTATDRGFLMPRQTTTQRNALSSPATGLQVYDTDLKTPCYYDGTWLINSGSYSINSTTVGLTSANLNSSYPNVPVGHRVICPSITLGGAIYTKVTEAGSSDVWLMCSAPVVM